MTFEFDPMKWYGWHYTWRSHKHKRNTHHTVCMLLFAAEADSLRCLAEAVSAPFVIGCTRRRVGGTAMTPAPSTHDARPVYSAACDNASSQFCLPLLLLVTVRL